MTVLINSLSICENVNEQTLSWLTKMHLKKLIILYSISRLCLRLVFATKQTNLFR